jgi:hypothetical protein
MRMKKILIALISCTSLSLTAQTSSVEYTYDPAGNRIQRTVLVVGGLAQQNGEGQQEAVFQEHLALGDEGEIVFNLYPNPSQADVDIKVEYQNMEQQTLSYLLYDVSGKLLESKQSFELNQTLSLQNHPPGVYYLRIFSHSSISYKEIKILKK